MDEKTLHDGYDAWHSCRAEADPLSFELSDPWHKTVAKRVPDLNEKRILEIGCGRGDFAIWLARKFPGAQIIGVDFSSAAIGIAQERAHSANVGVTFQVDDAQGLAQSDNYFDHVISCECLEHVPQPALMAREIYRVLKPDGGFILTTENYFNGMILAWINAWRRNQPFDSGSGVQPHENFFLYWRVKKLLETSGLRVTRMESNHFQWLLIPAVGPHHLRTNDFRSPFLKRLFRPFGRHFTFEGVRPAS